jgi:hypothetical protein
VASQLGSTPPLVPAVDVDCIDVVFEPLPPHAAMQSTTTPSNGPIAFIMLNRLRDARRHRNKQAIAHAKSVRAWRSSADAR